MADILVILSFGNFFTDTISDGGVLGFIFQQIMIIGVIFFLEAMFSGHDTTFGVGWFAYVLFLGMSIPRDGQIFLLPYDDIWIFILQSIIQFVILIGWNEYT